jgi:hypothetical protein
MSATRLVRPPQPRRTAGFAAFLAAWAAVLFGLDRIETVKQFREARDRGDLPAARAYLAADARIWFDMPEPRGEGAPWTLEPDDWDRWDRFFHSKTEYSDWKDLGDRVTALGRETNDFYRLTEWTPKPLAFTWWFDAGGRIKGFLFHAVGEGKDPSRFDELKAWAHAHRPDELAYLLPKGRIDPSGDRPARWKALAIEWRRAAGLSEIELP